MNRTTARNTVIVSLLLLAAAVVIVLLAGGAGAGTASAQESTPAPTPAPTATPPPAATPTPPRPPANIAAVNGANSGEVNLTWDAAAGATAYRVGWIAHDDLLAAGANWLERFAFVDIGAKTAYTLTRLTPGADYWLIVASIGEPNGAPQWAARWVRLTLAGAPPPTAGPTPTPLPDGDTPLTRAELVRLVKPALAQLSYTFTDDNYPEGVTISGTGFIVRADGLLVTNAHVVRETETVTVHLQNLQGEMQELKGRVLGRGILADLALVQIDSDQTFPTLELGDSDAVQGADEVTAWGYPYGDILGTYPTVTRGIISSLGRIFEDTDYLQTDAAINPGNSGGPLVDRFGRVVGVNTAAVGGDNTGLAIASNEVKRRLDELESGGPAKATYRGRKFGYGYALDIPAGWYILIEFSECTLFADADGTRLALICAEDIAGKYDADQDQLAAHAEKVWSELREQEIDPLSFRRVRQNEAQFYRLEYRNLASYLECGVDHTVALVALSAAYPENPHGFTWQVLMCESSRQQHGQERQAMLDSFRP